MKSATTRSLARRRFPRALQAGFLAWILAIPAVLHGVNLAELPPSWRVIVPTLLILGGILIYPIVGLLMLALHDERH